PAPDAEHAVDQRALQRRQRPVAADAPPEGLEVAPRAVDAGLDEALRHDARVHGAGARARDRLDGEAAVLEQGVDDAPGEGAVRAAALQGEADALLGLRAGDAGKAARRLAGRLPGAGGAAAHSAVQPPSMVAIAPVMERPASEARKTA